MKKPNLIIVAGPTSSGKTSYAIKLAQKIAGEIVSADSRQVYRGINLLSGKVTKKEMAGIPHHMLDIADPRRTFSVAAYQKKAVRIIDDIIARGKTPILCGGTGFYIDAVVSGHTLPDVQPNPRLRKELAKKDTSTLFALLKKLDPKRARSIDGKNPVRLIRAIEIATALGKVPKLKRSVAQFDTKWILLDLPDKKLKARIHERLIERIDTGMLREAKKLHAGGVSYKRMESLGLECRSAARYLQGKITKPELIAELDISIWQYVKRQRTWFKKYSALLPPK